MTAKEARNKALEKYNTGEIMYQIIRAIEKAASDGHFSINYTAGRAPEWTLDEIMASLKNEGYQVFRWTGESDDFWLEISWR